MKAKKFQIISMNNGECNMLLTVTDYNTDNIAKLANYSNDGKILDVSIKKEVKHRSIEANAYCWTLLDKLAKVLNTTSEELYHIYILDYGVRETAPRKNEDVESHIGTHGRISEGSFSVIRRDSTLDGYTVVTDYYGSSTYNSKQMAFFIQMIVIDCEEQGIPTMTQKEIDRMIGAIK